VRDGGEQGAADALRLGRYCTSWTVKVPSGGTNITSKATTERAALAIAAPRL
jgi:hypothetical protein